MADGAQAIIKAGSKVFSSCPDCQYLNHLYCWNHTIRVVQAKTKQSKKFTDLLPNHFSMILIIYINSVNDYTFKPIIAKLESKYCKNNKE